MRIFFLSAIINIIAINSALAAINDTHPQLCENIRVQLSEDCSEESDTMDRETGALIKRSYQECYDQEIDSTVQKLNEYLTDELGIYPFDASYENDQVICDKAE
jgi:hypothetical protein